MANPLDNTIQKAEASVQQAQAPDTSLLWKLVLGAVIGLVVWYLRWKLGNQAQELAKLKTEKEQAAIDAANAKVQATVVNTDQQVAAAELHAADLKQQADELAAQYTRAQKEHDAQVARVDAIDNWKDLNRDVGVR